MTDPIPLRAKGVLLTSDDLSAWNDEMNALIKQRNDIESQIGELDEKIGLAKELLALITPRAAPAKIVSTHYDTEPPTPLTDAIHQILLSCNGQASYNAIKTQLAKDRAQATRLKANPNYFYTAVKRLKDRDIVIQDGTNLIIIEAKAHEQLPFEQQETKNPATEAAGS